MKVVKGFLLDNESFMLETAQNAVYDSDGRKLSDIVGMPDFPAYQDGVTHKAVLVPNDDGATYKLEWKKDAIETDGLIPEAASSTNQLADKKYVDFNTEQLAAKYLAADTDGNPFDSYAAFSAEDAKFYYAGTEAQPTKNDYVIINGDESIPEEEWISDNPPITRYWYTGTSWSFQYIVNNAPLNASQMASINSGITKDIVNGLKDLPADELMGLPSLVNAYLHDQNCIQFKENDNVAMVILDEMSKHTFPYSCKFMAADSRIASTLSQLPPVESKMGASTEAMSGFIIHAYCMGGNGNESTLPDYRRFCYLELSAQARNVNDLCRFKYWCRLANNTQGRPSESSDYTQLHWQRALTDNNYGFVTLRELAENDNVSARIMTDMSTQFRPYHCNYTCTAAFAPSITGVPAELEGAFSMHACASDGSNGLYNSAKWDMSVQVELVGCAAGGVPVKYVGTLGYSGSAKPATWPTITWQKLSTETVTAVR